MLRCKAPTEHPPNTCGGNIFHITFLCLFIQAAVKIPDGVRSEVFPVSGLGKNQEKVPVLITAWVISGVCV